MPPDSSCKLTAQEPRKDLMFFALLVLDDIFCQLLADAFVVVLFGFYNMWGFTFIKAHKPIGKELLLYTGKSVQVRGVSTPLLLSS